MTTPIQNHCHKPQ
jgi:hypothetical protein